MRTRILIVTAVLIIFTIAPAATAATIMEMTMQEAASEEAGRLGVTIDGELLRMDIEPATGQEKMSIIFRGDRDEMILLDHTKSEATVIDKATMDQIAAQMSQAMEQMEQAMANVPAEQRAMMQGMMKGKMGGMMMESPPPTEVRKTSETGTTNGYSWVKYDIYQEGGKIQECLVTDWSNLEIDPSTFNVFKEMAALFEEFGKSIGADMSAATNNPFEEMNNLEGFPVVTRQFEGGVMHSATELKSVTTRTVEAALFENPGYKVNKIEMQMKQKRR
jgi:hypothetical protein